MKSLANVFSFSSKNDAPPETNVVDVPLTSPDAQVAVGDGQRKPGIKRSFSFFGKKDKVTKAELLEKILDLQKQHKAVEISHKEEIQAFQSQLDQMEKKHETDVATRDEMHKTLEATIFDLKYTVADINPIYVKKLELRGADLWHAYSTLDENETPTKISIFDSNNLALNDMVTHKKLILTGVISDCFKNPFEGSAKYYWVGIDGMNLSRLLVKIDSCKLTDLFFYYHILSWKEYEKLVAGGTIKNVYWYIIHIKDDYGVYVPLEKILKKLPNLERFYMCDRGGSYKKETFKNLLQLPSFKNLQEFKLSNIFKEGFDMVSFFGFMKKHPNAHFTLEFASIDQAMKEKIYKNCPKKAKLTIDN